MCGVAGAVLSRGSGTPPSVEGQLRHLDHRGPDSWGVYAKGRAAIGQTRLAVIDLVSGDPPITNENGTVGAVLNGEIYNYSEIRDELRERGHDLATRGDTEVLAHLAEDLEPVDLARRLDGMFAFAVWDDTRQRLVLGRDRLGKKPLYYWFDREQGRLVFASEIKAVLAQPWVTRDLDDAAIPTYLVFGYVPTPRTFYRGVFSVPPGHILVLSDGELRLEAYWSPPVAGIDAAPQADLSMAAAAASVRGLLAAAVERRLVADVPLGAFLSGGVDSSAVVALMAEASPRAVSTFTIGFEDDDGFDERPHARLVAERFGTEHTEFVVRPDAVDLVDRLLWHYDQPFGDSSAIPTFLLSQLTRSHVTVALCGDGGDELFAGYERVVAALALHRFQRVPLAVRRLARASVASLPVGSRRSALARLQRFLASSHLDVPSALLEWVSYVPDEWRRRLAGAEPAWGVDDYLTIWEGSRGARPLDRLLDLNVKTYLLDDLLPKVDRMSMAHALEVRSPFLDRELVEFALTLPPELKVQRTSGKRILKDAMRGLLPNAVLERRKQGFGVPLDRWFRSELEPLLRARVGAPEARLREHLHGGAVDALLHEHLTGTADHGHALWTLLTLELFLRREGW